MSVLGKICVRSLTDLQDHTNKSESSTKQTNKEESPPKLKRKSPRKAATTSKKAKELLNTVPAAVKKSQTVKKLSKIDERQKTIDCFFKSAGKNFNIPPSKEIRSPIKPKMKKSRRKIIYDDKDKSDTSVSNESKYQFRSTKKTRRKPDCLIDLSLLDSDDEEVEKLTRGNKNESSNATNLKNSKKNKRWILDSSSSRTSEAGNIQNNGTVLMDADKPASQETYSNIRRRSKNIGLIDISPDTILCGSRDTSACESKINSKRTSISKNSVCKTPTEGVSPAQISTITAFENTNNISQPIGPQKFVRENQDALTSPPSTAREVQSKAAKELLSSILENTPPMTSLSVKGVQEQSNDKENCVPSTPPHSSFSRFQEQSETNVTALNESSTSTTIKTDDIVEISDDDFEYAQIETKNDKTKASNLRKTRSNTKNIEPKVKKLRKLPPPHPPYKIVEGTNGTMAVDAFRFGYIEGVSYYFLTHFHADHYIGLTRKFSKPIYMSSITARYVRAFIPIQEDYIKELELNVPIKIDDVEVTAIDANHCPGAVMLIFKLSDGRCILHTGDFRASADMESEPIFWNNDIHTIYLDTTYISKKYAFCSQFESIERAIHTMEEFIEKNVGTRILYICGAYLIGKEKFWRAIASHFKFKVYAEGNRKKALAALGDETLNAMLTENPCNAQLHVISLQKLSYASLVEYYNKYAEYFDMIFALRPSGWEKNSHPHLRGNVNIFGIEYSEHSSYDEMKRFVQYLKPQNVISTVPITKNPMITAKVPQKWYKYTALNRQYQPSITSFFKMKPDKYFFQLTEKYTTILTNNATVSNSKIEQTLSNNHELSMMVSPNSALNAKTIDNTILTNNAAVSNSEIEQNLPNNHEFTMMVSPNSALNAKTIDNTILTNNATVSNSEIEQTLPNNHELSMMVSPNSALNAKTIDNTIDQRVKPKHEMLAIVPNIPEAIIIDCDTDDDWLS